MGALSNLQVIHIATHDSIREYGAATCLSTQANMRTEEGQNGPTHQAVEVDSLFRAMPNLLYFRPADAEEVMGAWMCALRARETPSMLSLARDPVGATMNTNRAKVQYGAYVLLDCPNHVITLASCGSQLHHALQAARDLIAQGTQVRVVSAPCLDLFEKQDDAYKMEVFPTNGKPVVSVEEYIPTVWARYATASIGMESFGYSASAESNYARFGLDAKSVVAKVREYLNALQEGKKSLHRWTMLESER